MMVRSFSLLALSLILQSTLAAHLSILNGRPDFVLLMLVYLSLSHGPVAGSVSGWSIGLIQDFYGSPTNLGLNALCKTLIGYAVGYGKDGLFKESLSIVALVLLITGLAHDALYFLIYTRHDLSVYPSLLWRSSLPSIVYTVVLGIFLALCVAFRNGKFDARRLFPH